MRKNKIFTVNGIKIEINYDSSHSLAEVEKVIKNSFEKVGKFFSFSKVKSKTIQLELMYSRQEYNERLNRETQNWESAYVENGVIVILDPGALEGHSSHSRSEFPAIVAHELTHTFIRAINSPTLDWVNEGLAQYVADQDSGRPVDPDNINYFLENHLVTNSGYTNFINHSGYRISYLVVAYILKIFGQSAIGQIIKIPGDTNCTMKIENIFGLPIKEIKQQLKRDLLGLNL